MEAGYIVDNFYASQKIINSIIVFNFDNKISNHYTSTKCNRHRKDNSLIVGQWKIKQLKSK